MSSISDLPPEILVHIFSFYIRSEGFRKFLNNIPLVSKKWNNLHSAPVLWRGVISYDQCWTVDQLLKLGEKGFLTHARTLILEYMMFSRDESKMNRLIGYCHSLTELKISRIFLSKISLQILAEKVPKLERLQLRNPDHLKPEDLISILALGRNLKQLKLTLDSFVVYRDLLSTVANHCHSLEELVVVGIQNTFSIDDLATGCPKLRLLHLYGYAHATLVHRNHGGFENMVSFQVYGVDFGGLDLYSILRRSKNLEVLRIDECENLILCNISCIPSSKVEYLHLACSSYWKGCSKFLEEAVAKWNRTLTTLRLFGMRRDLTEVLESYLHQNPDPKLKILDFKMSEFVKRQVLVHVMLAAKNLNFVHVHSHEHIFLVRREDVEMFLSAMAALQN